jgi:hypothetical protein
MSRKTPRSATLDDLLAAPEGVWLEAPDGFDLTVTYEPAKVDGDRVVIPLPRAASKKLGARDGETFSATVERGTLVLRRIPRPRAKRARRA